MGQTLYNITSPDDHERLKFFLQYDGALDAECKKNFNLKLKRAGPRSETAVYEPVRLMGMHRLATNASHTQSPTSSTTVAIKNDVSKYNYCSSTTTSFGIQSHSNNNLFTRNTEFLV